MITHVCRAKTQQDRFRLERITGDCLEGAGVRVPSGGWARIDMNAKYRVGDIVHCNRISGQIGGYLKQLKHIEPNYAIVTTNYLDPTKNYEFQPEELLGVVTEVYDAVFKNRIYTRK